MYVVTFYSYRGGVGRTMAMANVAVEIAKRGRKVLIVDFDLEAPGISTFDFCATPNLSKGIVDYICEYKETLRAPKINDFVQHCTIDHEGARAEFWMMSSGRQDEHYAEKFQSINWEELYSERSGFLLMENLKEQWNDYLHPDYVFIDSRTGHTDISGICTRQLPDSVVFNFFPNSQNLAGLKQVVKEVRAEGTGARKKNIQMHFVASPVPSMDDEWGILSASLEKFKVALEYEDLNMVYYYPSLSMMNQDIFTLVKPTTTLAKAYVSLADKIVRNNPEDRDGALSYIADTLGKLRKDRRKFADDPDVIARMDQIAKAHPSDGEVHAMLADLYFQRGDLSHATTEYEQAVKASYETSGVLLTLSFLYGKRERQKEAVPLLLKLAEKPSADLDVHIAILQLIELDASVVPAALASDGVRKLSVLERVKLSQILRAKLELVPYAMDFLVEAVTNNSIDEDTRSSAKYALMLCKIAMGSYADAIADIGEREQIISSNKAHDVFNYAMAEWGLSRSIPVDLFQRVVDLSDLAKVDDTGANYAQCLAVANHAIGNATDAQEWLKHARQLASQQRSRTMEFSCWSYLNLPISEFIGELDKTRRMLSGGFEFRGFMTGEAPVVH